MREYGAKMPCAYNSWPTGFLFHELENNTRHKLLLLYPIFYASLNI